MSYRSIFVSNCTSIWLHLNKNKSKFKIFQVVWYIKVLLCSVHTTNSFSDERNKSNSQKPNSQWSKNGVVLYYFIEWELVLQKIREKQESRKHYVSCWCYITRKQGNRQNLISNFLIIFSAPWLLFSWKVWGH